MDIAYERWHFTDPDAVRSFWRSGPAGGDTRPQRPRQTTR